MNTQSCVQCTIVNVDLCIDTGCVYAHRKIRANYANKFQNSKKSKRYIIIIEM